MRYSKKTFDKLVEAIQEDGIIVIVRQKDPWKKTRIIHEGFLKLPQMIIVGAKGPVHRSIAVLINEYGAAIVWRENKGLHKMLYRTFSKYFGNDKLTKREAKAFVDYKRAAWKHGFAFLKRQGVPISEGVIAFRNWTLAHHRRCTTKQTRGPL